MVLSIIKNLPDKQNLLLNNSEKIISFLAVGAFLRAFFSNIVTKILENENR